ncbi:FAD-binding oxidoreductase [Paraburkholderia sp. SARCC-3016]|uniref:FAD-binding oxidoreductase n=1 Tax=Paraburkholderia sp. SARCC-3016 TaxID=3058611 RepID=UPI002806F11A|nr:FAD-binding oxidoreductase [Paraburkholderia sp. SARCC-3016]MDQ7978907.1 FAD-binding oxidoreductase [Paraburkholderia sp. SARCC-3016]
MASLKKRDGSSVTSENLSRFIESFSGKAFYPNTPAYEAARVIWNRRISRSPGLIVQCSSTHEIAQAVNFARENDLVMAVKGGGHNVAGHALCDDGLVIDLSPMKQVIVDEDTPTVTVQGGALLEDLDRATHRFGLAVPTGVVSKVGVAGLMLGGGCGWLSRRYGLTCDSLLSCEIVTAQGETLTAHQSEHADLFWAIRGGAGNFGIVSSLTFRAHPVSKVYGGFVAYPRNEAAKVVRSYRDFMAHAPDELTVYAGLMSTPDGTPAVALMMCYCGTESDGERVTRPLLEMGTPLFAAVQSMPFPDMQRLADQGNPDGIHNYWRSTFIKELSDAAIELIVEQSNLAASPLSMVLLQIFDGAVRNIGVADTAYSQRDAGFNVAIEAKWIEQRDTERNIGWARDFANALRPHSANTCLVNFLSDESGAEVRAAFGSNHTRLARIKAKYDPANFFRLNPNIEPQA